MSRSVAVLGSIGLGTSGPLLATLLIGRTGAVPGMRWLGLAVAGWVTLSALAWAISGGTRQQTRWSAMTTLVPLAAVSALLPLLYLDDGINHVVSSGELRTTYVTVTAVLASIGFSWRLAVGGGTYRTHVDGATATEEDGGTPLRLPMLGAPVVGLLTMVGLNDLVFEPLGSRGGEITLAHALPGALIALAGWSLLVRSRLVRLEAALAVLATAFASLAILSPVLPWLVPLVQPAVVALTLLSVIHPMFWRRLSSGRRWATACPMVGGFVLVSTQMERYELASRGLVNVSLHTVSPPVFGLLLVSAAMALRAASPDQVTEGLWRAPLLPRI